MPPRNRNRPPLDAGGFLVMNGSVHRASFNVGRAVRPLFANVCVLQVTIHRGTCTVVDEDGTVFGPMPTTSLSPAMPGDRTRLYAARERWRRENEVVLSDDDDPQEAAEEAAAEAGVVAEADAAEDAAGAAAAGGGGGRRRSGAGAAARRQRRVGRAEAEAAAAWKQMRQLLRRRRRRRQRRRQRLQRAEEAAEALAAAERRQRRRWRPPCGLRMLRCHLPRRRHAPRAGAMCASRTIRQTRWTCRAARRRASRASTAFSTERPSPSLACLRAFADASSACRGGW